MVELVGSHRPYDAQVVDVLFQMRKAVRDPLPALPDLMKRILSAEEFGHAGQKRKSLSCQQRGRTVLAVETGELGLVLKELKLAGRTRHMKVYDALGARGKLGRQDPLRGLGIMPDFDANRSVR